MIQILWKFLYLLSYSQRFNQATILHMSRQLSCRGMGKIVTWLDHYYSHKNNMYF